MPNHPNRSGYGRSDASKPKPDEIREFRRVHGLTAEEAGELVHVSGPAWERWESGERPMHPAFFELARIKVRLIEGHA